MRVHVRQYSAAIIALLFALTLSACGMMQKEQTQAAAEEAVPLSDPEIVAVLSTLNRGEVTQAEMALQRSGNEDVRDVAQRILDEHMTMQERLEEMASRTGLEPQENELSRSLDRQANKMTEQLAATTGREFDQAYLQGQTELHQLALDTVKTRLLPDAENPQLREMLQRAAPRLEAHRDEAEQSQASLPSARG